jgi:hypothetical protein
MNVFDMNSEASNLRVAEEGILASFTRRLIDIAAVSGARGSAASPTAALNAMGLPAIAIDRHGFVVDANAAAEVVFDDNIRIKDAGCSFAIRTREPFSTRRLISVALEPVIVPRADKLPVIVRIWGRRIRRRRKCVR